MSPDTAGTLRRLLAAGIGFATRHAAEVASVIAGHRPCARVAATAAQADVMTSMLRRLGLEVGRPEVIHRVVRRASADRFCERTIRPEVFAATDHLAFVVARTREEADTGQRIDDEGDATECGRMLGFPACCTQAYERIERGTDWVTVVAASVGDSERNFRWSANCLASLFSADTLHPDLFPCRLGCPRACAFVESLVEAARRCGLDRECDAGLAAMTGSVAIMDGVVVSLRRRGDIDVICGCEVRPPRDARWRDLLSGDGLAVESRSGGLLIHRGGVETLRAKGVVVRFRGGDDA